MEENELIELLSAQPRTGASDGFRERTLARLARPPAVAPSLRRFAAAAAVALTVLSGVAGHHAWRQHQRVEALREEHQELEAELQRLKSEAAGYEPVVYLGGDESADYIVDLRSLQRPAAATRTVSNRVN